MGRLKITLLKSFARIVAALVVAGLTADPAGTASLFSSEALAARAVEFPPDFGNTSKVIAAKALDDLVHKPAQQANPEFWPEELTLFLPYQQTLEFNLLPQGENMFLYNKWGDGLVSFLFKMMGDYLSWLTVYVDPRAPKGSGTAIGQWLLEQSRRKFPANPMPLSLDMVSSPLMLGVACKLFRQESLEISSRFHKAWVALNEIDLYGFLGPLQILPSALELEKHYTTHRIEIQKTGAQYHVKTKPDEVDVAFDGPLITVRDRATGQRLHKIHFDSDKRYRIRGVPLGTPAASSATPGAEPRQNRTGRISA